MTTYGTRIKRNKVKKLARFNQRGISIECNAQLVGTVAESRGEAAEAAGPDCLRPASRGQD